MINAGFGISGIVPPKDWFRFISLDSDISHVVIGHSSDAHGRERKSMQVPDKETMRLGSCSLLGSSSD